MVTAVPVTVPRGSDEGVEMTEGHHEISPHCGNDDETMCLQVIMGRCTKIVTLGVQTCRQNH